MHPPRGSSESCDTRQGLAVVVSLRSLLTWSTMDPMKASMGAGLSRLIVSPCPSTYPSPAPHAHVLEGVTAKQKLGPHETYARDRVRVAAQKDPDGRDRRRANPIEDPAPAHGTLGQELVVSPCGVSGFALKCPRDPFRVLFEIGSRRTATPLPLRAPWSYDEGSPRGFSHRDRSPRATGTGRHPPLPPLPLPILGKPL